MLNKLSQTFNRALIKRVDLLPNVSEFNTHRTGIHEFAAVYGIEKVLRKTEVIKLNKGSPNRYLERVAYTLTKYAIEDRVPQYNKLSEIVQRKSIAFRVLALNRTIDNWFTLPLKKLDSIWRSLSSICRNNSAELKFKRVWIDKKPGDYARPLGVPTPAWRCWSYMKMDHLERFYKGSGRLQPWQHGGRSGVGVLSCYKQLIPKMIAENTIYEFDIKGFFDNISHESIINRIKQTLGIKQSQWVAKILASKPVSYTLPPREEDKAVQTSERIMNTALDIQPVSLEEFLRQADQEGSFVLDTPEALTAYVHDPIGIEDAVAAADGDWSAIEVNQERYKKAMEGGNVIFSGGEGISEAARAAGRDSWKSLGQPGKGVPQGLGTSPFLSTFLTDTYLYELGTVENALIMYMDDGILFAKNKSEMERRVTRLKELLGSLGLEIAPEKSKYVKVDGEWVDSIKFLGLRFLPNENTIMSDTRSGTKVKFPMNAEWDDVKTLAALNNSSISNVREKFDRLINTTAYEAGLRYGFLGCLIAGSQYKDAKSMEERRDDIRKGQNTAWNKITNSKGFIWKFQDLHSYTEYLTNVSSIQVHKFMNLHRKGGKLYHYNGRKHRQEILK